MKRLLKWISILLLLLVTAVIAAPFFIPLDSIKKIASERVKAMTGRDLIIAGDIKASFWPNIGVSLQKVTLSNPEGFSDKYMAEIEDLTVAVELLPLLRGKVQVEQFVIKKPIINLEINKQNVANWQFAKQKTDGETTADSTDSAAAQKAGAGAVILGKIKIEDGSFTYKDARNGKTYNIEKANLDVKMPSLDSELDVDANLIFNKEKVNMSLHAETPAQLVKGGDSGVKTTIKIGSLLSLTFDGKANMQGANGKIDLNAPSLIAVSAWSGKKLDWKGVTPLALDIHGAISCTASDCTLTKAKIKLDDNTLSGNMKVNFAGAIPAIDAKFTTDKFNLNHYLPKTEKQAFISLISAAQAAEGWDTQPLDFSGLRAVNVNLQLDAGELLYKNTTLQKMSLTMKLANGSLAVDIPHVEFYSGIAKISATANASNAVSMNFNADKIQIEPLLKDFAKSDRLTGTATMNISVTGKGATQRTIISSLGGNGDVKINDGTFKGVDIAKVITSTRAMITGVDTYSEKTKFSELGGTFTIAQGIVKNNDLLMRAPLLRLKGSGTVDLPNRYVNYRLIPSVVATLQGQGGKDKVGLDIPVNVEGDFESLKFTPDLGSIVEDTLKNPEKIKDTVKSIKETIKKPDELKNLLKGFR